MIRNHFKQLSTYRYRLHNDQSVSSQSQYSSDSDSFNKRSSEEDPKVFTSGLKRSQAFHTAELLQQQVRLTSDNICVRDDERFICCGRPCGCGWKLCSQFGCFKNFLSSFQLLVDEEEEFLEEDEDISKSESLQDTNNTFSGESHVSQTSLGATSEIPGGLSRSLKKSMAFHDRTSLEQQVSETVSHVCDMAAVRVSAHKET